MSEEQRIEDVKEEITEQTTSDLPAGIARLHDEWVKQGLGKTEPSKKPLIGLEPVIFPEPVGDYIVPAEDARAALGLSEDAMERLLAGGGLDSILVRFEEGPMRLVSESALMRFLDDTGMDQSITEHRIIPSKEILSSIDSIREELAEMKDFQSRQIQQFKDILLLELRNLKEQDRDLTSFVYDLTAGLEEIFPKLKKRKRTPPPDKSDQ